MKYVCDKKKCAGCMACVEVCKKEAITVEDTIDAYNAIVDPAKCVNCGMCYKVCPNNNPPKLCEPIKWVQGWANDDIERMQSSSGGFATAISKSFVEQNGFVCSCCFKNGTFEFEVTNVVEEIDNFRGSKYVKSNPINAYKNVRNLLILGNKVLFIGLPCQVAGIKNYVGISLQENLFTIDLICHGTPSPILLERYLKQDFKIMLNEIQDIGFRNKTSFRLSQKGKQLLPPRVQDKYTMAFLDGIDYTENCYSCRYATTSRVSDLTIGDSWASELSIEECKKGVSLGLCQNEKGKWLLENANLYLCDVNIENAIKANRQLRTPSVLSIERKKFIKHFKQSDKFSLSLTRAKPKECLKQDLKQLLYKFKILKGGGTNVYNISILDRNEQEHF